MTNNSASTADTCFENLQQHFSNQEIVELTMIVAAFNMWNRFNGALGLDVDVTDKTPTARAAGFTREEVDRYLRRILPPETPGSS